MSCNVLTADPFAGFRSAMAPTTAVTAPSVSAAQKETPDPLITFGTLCGELPEGKDYSCLLPPSIPIDDREELGSCASTTAAAPLSGSLTKDPTSPVVESLEGIPLPPSNQPATDIPAVTKTAPATPVTPTIATPSPIANNASPITKHSPPLAPAKPSYMPTTVAAQTMTPIPKSALAPPAVQTRVPLPATVQTALPMNTLAASAQQLTRQVQPAAAPVQQQQQYVLQTYPMQMQAQAAVQQPAVPAGYQAGYYQIAQNPAAAQSPVYYATSNGYYYQASSGQPAAVATQAALPMQMTGAPVYYGIQNPATGQLQYYAAQPTAQAAAPTVMHQYAVMANPAAQQASAPQLMYNTAPAAYSVPSAQSVYYVQQAGVPATSLGQAGAPSVAYYTYAPTAVRR